MPPHALRDSGDAGPGLAYRLAFLLPAQVMFAVRPGRHCPCLHGCVLTVERNGLVWIEGPSHGQVLEQVRRFLKIVAKRLPTFETPATLTFPDRPWKQNYTIIVNAAISIVPCATGPILIDGRKDLQQ